MSRSATGDENPETERERDDERAAEEEPEETPEIEEDLVSEELRIDGICGVY